MRNRKNKVARGITRSALSSPDVQGCTNFDTSIILLSSFAKPDASFLRKAMRPPRAADANDPARIDAYRLIVHEVTHYLDLTTTLWGLEFLVRRDRALAGLAIGDHNALEVAMLNFSELQMHWELTKIHQNTPLTELEPVCQVHYSQRHGAMVTVLLYKHGERVAETPLSMLSLIEANALASEVDAELRWYTIKYGYLPDAHEARIASGLDGVLKSPKRLEYNVLHIIARRFFPGLDLSAHVKLIMAITSFTLNLSTVELSRIGDGLSQQLDGEAWEAICMDMRRGMSRNIVAFKVIEMMYRYATALGLGYPELSAAIQLRHQELIRESLNFTGVLPGGMNTYRGLADIEAKVLLGVLRSDKHCYEPAGHLQAITRNRRIRSRCLSTAAGLRRFRLLDLVLGDDSVIRMPTRLRADVQKLNDTVLDQGGGEFLRQINKPEVPQKFHLPPGTTWVNLS
ncbi:hypothetical protein ACSVIJ_04505 [Pseudomonas sp. NCHU5208]|uniref:hypothetical protein n=1 Tax=unclassified Pseudomonas TaxID=196821 RepID=UPI003F9A81FD